LGFDFYEVLIFKAALWEKGSKGVNLILSAKYPQE
jgi:hypothetical protein